MNTFLALWPLTTCVWQTPWRTTCRWTGASGAICSLIIKKSLWFYTVCATFNSLDSVYSRCSIYCTGFLLYCYRVLCVCVCVCRSGIIKIIQFECWRTVNICTACFMTFERAGRWKCLIVATVPLSSFISGDNRKESDGLDFIWPPQGDDAVRQTGLHLQRDSAEAAARALHETLQHVSSVPEQQVRKLLMSAYLQNTEP